MRAGVISGNRRGFKVDIQPLRTLKKNRKEISSTLRETGKSFTDPYKEYNDISIFIYLFFNFKVVGCISNKLWKVSQKMKGVNVRGRIE